MTILGWDPGPYLPLLIFVARIADVSVGTTRLICVMRGQRLLAVVLGFVEIIIWVFAVSSVLSQLGRWANLLAYAGGFAAGNAIGMWLEGRLALGIQAINLFSQGSAAAVAERLRFGDFCVTTLAGQGRHGPVSICHVIVPRKLASSVIRMAREVDPDVVVTVEDVRETTAFLPYRMGAGKTPLPLRGLGVPRILAALRGERDRTVPEDPHPSPAGPTRGAWTEAA